MYPGKTAPLPDFVEGTATYGIRSNCKHKLTAIEHREVNIREEAAQKSHVDQWRKACEVEICRHIDHAVTQIEVYE